MNSEKMVSVLMTAYNREKYIAEAIESVLASTFQDFELIIVDDYSNDKTVQIAKSYEARDCRIKVYINESNLGDYPNRNKAASYAKGKYLKYLDSDDIMYSHCLEVMVNAMEKFPNAAVGLTSNIKQFLFPYPHEFNPKEMLEAHFEKYGFLDVGPSGIIFKRDVFEKIGGFSGKRFYGDTELLLKICNGNNSLIFNGSLIFWRIHPEQEFFIEHETGGNWKRTDLLMEYLTNGATSLDLDFRRRHIKKHLWLNTVTLIKTSIKKRSITYLINYKDYTLLKYSNIMIFFFKI